MTAPTAKRQILSLAKPPARSRAPTFSQIKKAIKLFRGRGVSKATYRRNALAWLRSVAHLGDKHILKGGEPRWGVPGDVQVEQVFAPRRLGAK